MYDLTFAVYDACACSTGLMTTMYDRRVFDEIGPFDAATVMGGDAEFSERLLAHYGGASS